MKKLLIVCLFSFISIATFAKGQFLEGFYIDLQDNKIEGYIFYRYDHKEWFKFKKKITDKAIKIRPKEVKGFTTTQSGIHQECVTLYNFTVKIGAFMVSKEADFAEVIVKGNMTLYKHYSIAGGGAPMMMGPNGMMTAGFGGGTQYIENFIIKRENSTLVVVPFRNKKKFRKRIGPLFAEHEKIKTSIDTKRAGRAQLELLVKEYNKRKEEEKLSEKQY